MGCPVSEVLQEPGGSLDWCEDVRDGKSGRIPAIRFRSRIGRASGWKVGCTGLGWPRAPAYFSWNSLAVAVEHDMVLLSKVVCLGEDSCGCCGVRS